jgi:histidinol-phosphate aminotransferase
LCPTDLRLDGNEGRTPSPRLQDVLAKVDPEVLRRYPDRGPLESQLAETLNISADSVLVTAGADDALDRICRSYLDSSRQLVTAVPTFEMIPRYARLAGASVRTVPWPGAAFPLDAILNRINAQTGVIAVVSPNNPTGAVATAADLVQLASAAPHAVLLVDLAYAEFADVDLMPTVLSLPNAIGVRSLSKAWGLAGLRVGFAAGSPGLVAPLRAAGGPYAVTGLSLELAATALTETEAVTRFADQIRQERTHLCADLTALGAATVPSQGNFVYAGLPDPVWARDGLAGLGIGVRLFAADNGSGHLRITCPGDTKKFARLRRSLGTVLQPEALLLDMDGVLADVSRSYRRAIVETGRTWDQEFTPAEVAAAKRRPGSNNDWVLTQGLLAERGLAVELSEVTRRFEAIYAGLRDQETLIPDAALLRRLAARLPLAIVTGRPRQDAERFLAQQGIADLFATLVCLEDAPGKPDPAPVACALRRLGVRRAWLVGDTVNDILAARAASVLPLGVVPPGEDFPGYPDLLTTAGAGRILNQLSDLEEVLP